MAAPLDGLPIALGSLLALGLSGALALYAIYRLDGRRRWGRALRRRFVLGLPWGTIVVGLFVIAVYLFVQGAYGRLREPVVVAFSSWSYSYPLGMVTAPFAHTGLGHVTGNLLSTIVFAPIAEYAWGHYPTARGSHSFGSLRTNPYARIGGFVVAVLLVGLATSFLVPGPLIGFSGVVFAFAGFVIVTKPIVAIFAIVARRVVGLAYYTGLDPVVSASAGPRFFEPWWADVAIQGHALGVLVGVLLGAVVLARRDATPSARHVWFAALVFAVTEALYAFYWQFGANRFVMFRGAGLAAVLVVATLVVVGIAASDREIVPRSSLNLRQVAVGLLLALVLGIGIAAVPYNSVDVDGPVGDGVEIRDYTVTYAEDVPHGYVQAVRLPIIGDRLTRTVNASGVIVTSDRRDAWKEVVSAGRLAFDGRRTVLVGGLGWRAEVVANRSTWNAIDAGSTYKVYLRGPDGPRRLVHRDEPVALAPTIAGVNLSIEPTRSGYRLNATRNGSVLERAPVPPANETVAIAGLTVERRRDTLVAVHDETRVRLARYEAGRRQG